eukprot:scaffold109_cov368-Pavlova_lutheri.AAC.6
MGLTLPVLIQCPKSDAMQSIRSQVLHRIQLCQQQAAGNGTPQKLVTGNGNAVRSVRKRPRWRRIQEREDEAVQSGIAVDVMPSNAHVDQGGLDRGDVVHGALHGRAHIGKDDGRAVLVHQQLGTEVLAVHGPSRQGAHHDVLQPQQGQRFGHAVVAFSGVVHHGAGEDAAGQMQAIQIALGSARSDIAPIRVQLIRAHAGQLETLLDHFALETVGVRPPELALDEWISDVVDMYG